MDRTNLKGAFFAAAAGLGLALMTTAAAAHGGGVGGGMGGQSGMHGNFGGNSASHISAQGLAHTNGPNAADRDFGRARAADVRSAHAQAHSGSHTSHAHTTASHLHAVSHRTTGRPIRKSTTPTSI